MKAIMVTYQGDTRCLTDWAKAFGLPPRTVMRRYAHGVRGDELFAPAAIEQVPLVVEYRGKTQCLKAWARELHIPVPTIYNRWDRGIRGEALFAPRVIPRTRTAREVTRGHVTKGLLEWADELGVPRHLVVNRWDRGIRGEALFAPAMRRGKRSVAA